MRPGFAGKLPIYGDFVSRGWSDALTQFLFAWMDGGITRLYSERGAEAAKSSIASARPWLLYFPSAATGDEAVFTSLYPSADRAGRDYFLMMGYSGADPEIWALAAFSPVHEFCTDLDQRAITGAFDADALIAILQEQAAPPDAYALFMASQGQPPFTLGWRWDKSEAVRAPEIDKLAPRI